MRSEVRRGAPDRCFVLRNRGPFTPEIVAYTTVLRSGPAKRRALTYIARGNAYLAKGLAKLALLDYGFAINLKQNLPYVTALKAEALAMLGRYPQALSAFDSALAARPKDGEIYSGRARCFGRILPSNAHTESWFVFEGNPQKRNRKVPAP